MTELLDYAKSYWATDRALASMNHQSLSELTLFVTQLRQGIWFLGIPSWLFGFLDRSVASWADQSLSAGDLIQVFTAAFFLVSWLLLKPTAKLLP